MEKFSLYDDEDIINDLPFSPDDRTDNDLVVSIDVGGGRSLHQLIEPVRSVLVDKPPGSNIILYLVCGKECSKDLDLFVNYLSTLDHKLNIFIRGNIHPEMFGLLLSMNTKIDKNAKLVYNRNKLHLLLTILIPKQDVLRKFLQRFVEVYYKFPQETLLDLTELNMIGLEIETF